MRLLLGFVDQGLAALLCAVTVPGLMLHRSRIQGVRDQNLGKSVSTPAMPALKSSARLA